MAAPHVTGTVALLLQQNNDYTPAWIKQILLAGGSISNGFFALDVFGALDFYGEPNGIEDDIYIASGPITINQNQSATYTASFYDAPPEGDRITSGWSWSANVCIL
jgi:subtilisin family serine protease